MNDELTENGTFINIEYHKSRVSELEKQLAEYEEIAAKYGIDGKTMLALAKSQIETALDNARLQEALEDSRRREKAAVEDLRDSANCDSVCKHGRCNDNDCEEHKGTLTEFGVDRCFEWRGPQERSKV